jgi:hypothetical protein
MVRIHKRLPMTAAARTKEMKTMKYGMGAALAVAAILTGSATLPTAVLADEAAAVESKTGPVKKALQQELEARLQKDAEAVAADAMAAASDLDLPLELEGLRPGTLVLVSDL